MRWLVCGALLLGVLGGPAEAHPMSRDKYSLRTAVRLSTSQLDAVVVLEVPMDVVTSALRARIDAATAASTEARAVVDAYSAAQWQAMAAGLSLTIDGQAVPGRWLPREDRFNGKGAVSEGFFMYIVEFRPDGPLRLDGDVTVRVVNKGFTEVPMVYSAWVLAGDGWTLASSSAQRALPGRAYDLNDPAFWVEDPSLRTVEARFVAAP